MRHGGRVDDEAGWAGAVTAFGDLVLGTSCVVCGGAARTICRVCRLLLAPDPWEVDARVTAARPYDEATARLVVAWKERGWWALTPDLALLLAAAVVVALGRGAGPWAAGSAGRGVGPWAAKGTAVDLVPVPTSRRNRRRRGRDHAVELGRAAASALAVQGVDARLVRGLRLRRQTVDQASLHAAERRRNVSGAFAARPVRWSGGPVVLVDDVTTTGATLSAATRALEVAGVSVSAVAVVAAVPGVGAPHVAPR